MAATATSTRKRGVFLKTTAEVAAWVAERGAIIKPVRKEEGQMCKEKNQMLYKRILQSIDDLENANDCARRILELKDEPLGGPVNNLATHLTVALTIYYARAFKNNKGSNKKYGNIAKKIPEKYLDVLSEKQKREVHDKIITDRDEAHAHADASRLNISVSFYEKGEVARTHNTNLPYQEEFCREIIEVTNLLLGKLWDEESRINNKLGTYQHF